MPSILEIGENTAPVVLTRGKIKITVQAYVERISYSNPAFAEQMKAAEKLDDERQQTLFKYSLQIQALQLQRAVFNSSEWRDEQLATGGEEATGEQTPKTSPRNARRKATASDETSELVASVVARGAQLQAQVDALDKQIEQLNEQARQELEAIQDRVFQGLCSRASFLISKWDVTEADGKTPAATTPEALEKLFGDKREFLGGWTKSTGEMSADGTPIEEYTPGLVALVEAATFGPLDIPSGSGD